MFNSRLFTPRSKPEESAAVRDTSIYHFIIDRSSSMLGMESFVEQGFNKQLSTLCSLQREFPERDYLVSLTYFNHEVERRIHAGQPGQLRPLRRGDYRPNGSTALLDALGTAISSARLLYDRRQRLGEVSVAIVVITDGEENSSMQYSAAAISRMVKDCEASGRWTFTFMGADFDASRLARRVSLSSKHCMHFDKANFAESMDHLSSRMHVYERRKSEGQIMKTFFQEDAAAGPDESLYEKQVHHSNLPKGLRL